MRLTRRYTLAEIPCGVGEVRKLLHDGHDQHQDQHDQLNDEHHDVHDQLNDIHNDAHDQGLSWYEHQRLHQQLDRAHARADGNIEAQHYYQHQAEQYGYGGYGGNNNGYYGYGAPQGYYGSNGYVVSSRGYGYRNYNRARRHRYYSYRGY